MIKVNETFSFQRDKFDWVLREQRKGFDKKRQVETQCEYTTYHPSLEQVCKAMIDRYHGNATTISKLKEHITKTKKEILAAIEQVEA